MVELTVAQAIISFISALGIGYVLGTMENDPDLDE